MLQLTLMTVAAPALMALGFSGRAGKGNVPASGPGLRVGPLPLAAAYGLLIWLWHVPTVYEAVLNDAFIHVTLIGLVIAVSMAFWHSLFDITQRPAAFAALGTTALHTGLLGAILTFAPRAFYPSLAGGTGWSFAPLADQQLAGLIMWVFGGALYLAVAVALAVAWLRELESADRREAAA
jgi:cytochrome c oxidase assembly factor CtaG